MKTRTRIIHACDECNTEIDGDVCKEHPNSTISSIQIVENYDMESVKAILMRRDGMSEKEAQELIDEFVEELGKLEDDEYPNLEAAYDLIQDYFGLEPDYLEEFL